MTIEPLSPFQFEGKAWPDEAELSSWSFFTPSATPESSFLFWIRRIRSKRIQSKRIRSKRIPRRRPRRTTTRLQRASLPQKIQNPYNNPLQKIAPNPAGKEP